MLGEEIHGASGPVGAEIAGLDACEVDVLFWIEFVEEDFDKAFGGLFGGAVDVEHWHCASIDVSRV